MKSPKNAIYFPNLNGLRIISCYIVVIFHINQLKGVFGYEKFNLSIIGPGNIHLTMFFVMSGFLITYLILREKDMTNSINIKKFYIRRVLRIWPLYFVMLLLGFFILPHFSIFQFPENNIVDYPHFWQLFTAFVLFFPHLHGIFYDVNITLSPLWSIGVEEQFYIVWPFIIGYTKRPITILFSIIFSFFILRYVDNIAILFGLSNHEELKTLQWISVYFYKFRLGSMAIGGLLAILYLRRKTKLLSILYHPLSQKMAWISLLCLQLFPSIRPHLFEHEVYSSIFGVIMINLATNPKATNFLDVAWLRNFGELAYASYVLHIPVILVCLHLVRDILSIDLNSNLGNILFFSSSIAFTFCLSYFSYHCFESKILVYKKRFSTLKTRTH